VLAFPLAHNGVAAPRIVPFLERAGVEHKVELEDNMLNCSLFFPHLAAAGRPPGFWSDIDNQRAFLEEVAENLGISKVRATCSSVN